MGVVVIRQVTVKARVTEELKRKLAADLQEASRRLDEDMSRLEFQGRRLVAEVTRQDVRQADQLRQALEVERHKHGEAKAEILDRLREVASLAIGSEIVQDRVNSPVEIEVGDDWNALSSVEILLEDGKVVKISP